MAGALTSRLGRRFVLLFTVCALLPLVIFATLSVTKVSEQVRQETKENLRNAAKNSGMAVAARLDQIANDLSLAADLVQSWRSESVWAGAEALKGSVSDHCRAMWQVEGDRVRQLCGDMLFVDPGMDGLQREQLAAGKTVLQCVGEPLQLMMSLAVDPEDDGDLRIVALINPDWFWDPQELRGTKCDFAACDSRGRVLYHTFRDLSAADVIGAGVLKSGGRGANNSSGMIEWDIDGEPHMGRYWQAFLKPQYAMDVFVIQSRARSDALAVEAEFVQFFWLTAIGTLLFVVLGSLVQIRRTLDPIVSLRDATQRIGHGELDVRVWIESPDEFGDLGTAFNDMAERLQQNIAQREKTETELVASRDAALLAVQAKAEFVTNVSHEFRTPMTEILGATEILTQVEDGEDKDGAVREEFSTIALHGAQRLARLLDDVLELGEVENDSKAPVEVPATIREAVAGLETSARGRVELEIEDGLANVMADRRRLTDVWGRLLDNAVKFSEPDTPIKVRAKGKGDTLQVDVMDRGIGIAAEDLESVFEPFSQVGHDQMVNKANGTGLGLSLARSAVESFGGTIAVSSKLGGGSIFRVTLLAHVAASEPIS